MPKAKSQHLTSAKYLTAIQEISRTIISDLYMDDILRLIVTVTAKVMNSKICSLMLIDEAKKELVIKATQSISPLYNKKPNLRLGEGISGRVAQQNRPIQVLDVRKDPRYINRNIATAENLCSLLSVPLNVKNRVIGVLNLYTASPHKFSKTEVDTLITVGNQSAIVIENAQLIVKTKIIQEELEIRKLVERAKGILMQVHNLSEDAAFRLIQKKSMDTRKPMKEIAEAIIISNEIKS